MKSKLFVFECRVFVLFFKTEIQIFNYHVALEEFLLNENVYRSSFYDQEIDFKSELEKVIAQKSYGNQIADMMVNALSSATRVSSVLKLKKSNKNVQNKIQTLFFFFYREINISFL